MKLKGWKHILTFTYLQTLRSKSFKIATAVTCILMALICIAINVLPALLAGGGDSIEGGDITIGDTDPEETEAPSVNTLYIYSNEELGFELFPVEEVAYQTVTESEFSEKKEQIALGDQPDMLLYIYVYEGNFYLTYYRPEDQEILPEYVVEKYADLFTEAFSQGLYLSIGVDEADLPLAQAEISTYMAATNGEESWMQELLNVILPMAIALVFYMFIMMYSQQIAQSMAVEKSSRVVELLITSARPLAIITGKIAGTILISMTQVAIIGAAGSIAFAVTSPFALVNAANAVPGLGEASGLVGGTVIGVNDEEILISQEGGVDIAAELADALPGLFNIGSIAAVVITLILGFLFFALLAGLVGASVSRMEDLGGALQPLMLLAVAGFMLSYLPAAMNYEGEMDSVITFSHFFPISSPFALPSAILMGQIGGLETVIALVMLALMAFLAVLLTAKVYESMILYSGNRLTIRQIIKMVKKG